MKVKKNQSSLTELNRVMPQALEIERAVLGALLLEPAALEEVVSFLKPKDFYQESNRLVYQAILNLYQAHHPVDMLTVMEELKRMNCLEGAGGAFGISSLSSNIASSSHIGFHARVLIDKSLARQMIVVMNHSLKEAYDESQDISEVIETCERDLTRLIMGTDPFYSCELADALQVARQWAEKKQEIREKGGSPGISTGIESLDRILGVGWESPVLIILGARTSMGKTQHALCFARAAARQGKHVLYVSLEMCERQLAYRLILEDERIDYNNIRKGNMTPEEWEAMERKMGELWSLPIHMAANHQIRYLNNIRTEARRLRRQGKLDFLIIDYLGLIRTQMVFPSRYLEVGYITGELKSLAKELDIPVMLLSQLSRLPKGVIREPVAEDLRESGDIEQDADIIILLHKPDYYEPSAMDSAGVPWKNRGKYLIAKQRDGIRNQTVIFYHDERYKKITDYPFTSDR